MNRNLLRALTRSRVLPFVLIVLGLVALGINARPRFIKNSTVGTIPARDEPAAKTTTPDKPAATRLPAHLIILRPMGFEPSEAHWPKGPFFLVVDNRSGLGDITLRVDREVGGRLKEVNVKTQKHRWAGVLDPPPGRYLLTEANHPAWVCHITITPQ